MNDLSQFQANPLAESLAMLVASGCTIRDAAKKANCSESHAYRLSREADFRDRVCEIRSEITAQAVGRLTDLAVQAVDVLAEMLGRSNKPSVRLNAAKAILGALKPFSELGELRARLEALEAERCS
jgi:hypothetical protein